ncbi:ABC transporter substrate-binding protein [Mycetocola zhadangensis]|uniref:ABC transporter substrate-binding protein n=1 Tax=Mycetocola zhadangensis TaxID=1164595 RepID=UPI003A4DDC86
MKKSILSTLAAVATVAVLSGCSASAAGDTSGSKELTKIVIAEPVHGVGYLPLYAAMANGYFEDAGLDVEITTLTGGAHVNAVLSGDAWGFIGGPESGAIANAKGAELVTIAGVVNKANIYWTAAPDVDIDPDDLAGSLQGKSIAIGRHGGSPEIISLYLMQQFGIDPDDMVITNNDQSGSEIALVQADKADIAVTTEPVLGQGITEGVWTEPFVNVPAELGDFAYSSIVIDSKTTKEDPDTVKAFTAALDKGMNFVLDDPDGTAKLAATEFPTMAADVLQPTLDRAYADELWNGIDISDEGIQLDLDVARDAGLLVDNGKVTIDTLLDRSFMP